MLIEVLESEAKDRRIPPKPQRVQDLLRLDTGHRDPRSLLPKHVISEDDGVDSSDTVIHTPHRRRSSFTSPNVNKLMESGTSFGNAEGSGIGQLSAGTKNPAQHARMNSLRGPTAHSMPTAQPKDLKEDPMDKALPPLPRNPEKTVSFLGWRPITGIDPAGGQALRAVSSPREPTSTGENDLQDFNGQTFSGKPCQRSERTLFRPLSAISANGRPIQNSPVRVHYQPETYQPPQKGLGQLEIGKTLGKEQTRPSIREKKETLVPRALVSDEDSEKVSKGATCKLPTEYPLEFSTQRAVETCGLQTIATTSPFKSSLIYQDPSVAPELLNVDQMVQYPIHNLFEDHLIMTERRPMQASRPFVDQLMILERMGIHEDLICLQNQEEAEDLAAKTAPTHITTTTGFDQGPFTSNPCLVQPGRTVSESWSTLQNRHMARQCDEQMSASTEDISTESLHQLANVKQRTRALVPKATLVAPAEQNTVTQKMGERFSVKNLADSDPRKEREEISVTPPTSMSTSPLTVLGEAIQRRRSKVVALGAERAAVANSGSKMAETRKSNPLRSENSKVLPLSLRKPYIESVPSRRLRSSFRMMGFLDKSPPKPNSKCREVTKTNANQDVKMVHAKQGEGFNQKNLRAQSKIAIASPATSKVGCSTSTTLEDNGSEGGDIESRLRREVFHKGALGRATHGKQIVGSLARWYWTVISPCLDPTSHFRKRLDANKSTWADFGLFLFALSSGFILLAVAVRIAQGMTWAIRMMQGILGGLIAILGS